MESNMYESDLREWLSKISSPVNWQQKIEMLTFTLQELHKFASDYTSPPRNLQRIWTAAVWLRAGEPSLLYLLRCIALHNKALEYRENCTYSNQPRVGEASKLRRTFRYSNQQTERFALECDIPLFSAKAITESVNCIHIVECKIIGVRCWNGRTHLVQEGIRVCCKKLYKCWRLNYSTHNYCHCPHEEIETLSNSSTKCKVCRENFLKSKHSTNVSSPSRKYTSPKIEVCNKCSTLTLTCHHKNYYEYAERKNVKRNQANAFYNYVSNKCNEEWEKEYSSWETYNGTRWSKRSFFVVELADGRRCTAVAFGDELLNLLHIGASYEMLVYTTANDHHKSMIHICSATMTPRLFTEIASPYNVKSSATDDMCASYLQSASKIFQENNYEHIKQYSVKSNLPMERSFACNAESRIRRLAKLSLSKMAEVLAPEILNETSAKTLMLLSLAHTQYCLKHFKTTEMEHQAHKKHSWWQPLHLVISGPSRTGKSTLLRSVQRLLGNDAALIEPTIIHRGQNTSFNDKRRWVSKSIMPSIQTILPYVHHDLLFAGPLLSQSVLLLDDMMHSSSSLTFLSADMLALKEMLSGEISIQTSKTYFEYCTPSSSSTSSSSNFASDAQVIIVAHAESKSITELTQLFSLTLRLHACLSIEDNIKHSERTIAASTSRSSLSTSLLHSSSSSSCTSASRLSTLSPSQEKVYRENVREFAQIDNVLEREGDFISYEDIKKIVDTSPTVTVLERFFVMKEFEHVYADKLLANYSLLKTSLVCVKPTSLPLPSALRGTVFCNTNVNHDNICNNCNQRSSSLYVDTTDVGSNCRSLYKDWNVKICDLSHVDFVHHLRILCALTLARLSLYGSELVCVNVEMAEEIWSVYSTHLRSVASYADDATCTSFQKESPNESLLFAARAREYSSSPLHRIPDEFTVENCDRLSNKDSVISSHNTCNSSYDNISSRMQNAGTDTHNDTLYALCDISSSKPISNTLLETYKILNGNGAGMCNGKRRRNSKNSSKKTLVQNFLHTINSIKQENCTVTTEMLMTVFEKYGGELGFGDSFSSLIEKLQFHGLIIRTRHGWVPTLLEYVKPHIDIFNF